MEWIKVKTRELTDEERESYPDDYENIWYMPFPEPPKVEEEIERDNNS